MGLRSKIVRLAHAEPELRPHLLPLLRQGQENDEEGKFDEEDLVELKEAAGMLYLDTDPATLEAIWDRYLYQAEEIRRMLDEAAQWVSEKGLSGSWTGRFYGRTALWELESSGFRIRFIDEPRSGLTVTVEAPRSSLSVGRNVKWSWRDMRFALRQSAEKVVAGSDPWGAQAGAALFVLKGREAFSSYMDFPRKGMARLIRGVFPKAKVSYQDRQGGPMWFVRHPLMDRPINKQKPYGLFELEPPGRRPSILTFHTWPGKERALRSYTSRLDAASVGKFLNKVKKKLEAAPPPELLQKQANRQMAIELLEEYQSNPTTTNKVELSDWGINTFRAEARKAGFSRADMVGIMREEVTRVRGLPPSGDGLLQYLKMRRAGSKYRMNRKMRVGLFVQLAATGAI